ncbi:hypothetical protein [Micromonospora tarapacensis]|uniref:hypothetical protein n=1 Tax=Micromonospora tarapacensis TaxID=2835305 RepID=UPI001E4BD9E1|nr:hypothetical protein [Micromonospora tarapacensis]
MSDQLSASDAGVEVGPVSLAAGIPAVGDRVISWYDDAPVEYGGGDGGPWTTLSFALLANGLPVRKCEPERVAPAGVPIPERDARVSVVKRTRAEMPYGESGVWQLTLPGDGVSTWHRTKRDATATGLRRLAILDWHRVRSEAENVSAEAVADGS